MEFSYNQPVEPAFFVGRGAVIAELENRLSPTVLIGEARIGKSSIMHYLKYRLAKLDDRSRRQVPVSINLRSPVLLSPGHFYRTVTTSLLNDEAVPRNVAKKVKPENVDSAPSLLNVLELLVVNSVRIVPVLLIDNIDQPEKFLAERFDFYSGLRQLIDFSPEPMPLKIVASATPSFLTLEPSLVSKLASRLRPSYLGAFTDGEVAELTGRSPLLSQCDDHDVVLRFICEQSGGHPCLVQELIVKTLDRRLPQESVLRRIETEVREISERGGSFFQSYVRDLGYEELFNLLPMSFGSLSSEWQMPPSSIKRFSSAGLIREKPDGTVDPSCTLFFRWFMQNVRSVMPHLLAVDRHTLSIDEFVPWFEKAVRASAGGFSVRSEKDVSGLVRGVLAGGAVDFEREVPVQFKTKQYRVDITVPKLQIAIELKYVPDSTRLGSIIDQVEVDALAYVSAYKHLIVVIVAPYESTRLMDYTQMSRNPFLHFIIVGSDR